MHGEHRAFAYIQTPHIQFIHANSWKRIVRKSPNVVAYWRKKQTMLTRCVSEEEGLIFLSVFCFLFFMRTKNWQQQIEWESKIDCDGAMSTENFMLCIQRLSVNTEHEHGIMPSLSLLLNDLMLSHSNHEHFNTQTMKFRFLLLFFLLSNECECMRPESSQNERLVRCWCIMCPYIRCWSLFQAEWINSQPKTYIRSCLTHWNLCWLKWIPKLFCFGEKGAHGNVYSTEILPLNNEKESRASCNKERRADNILLAPRAIFNANQNWYSLKSCIRTAWFIVLYVLRIHMQ